MFFCFLFGGGPYGLFFVVCNIGFIFRSDQISIIKMCAGRLFLFAKLYDTFWTWSVDFLQQVALSSSKSSLTASHTCRIKQ